MTSRSEHITGQRREKLERVRAMGINPYPNTFHRTASNREAVALLKQSEESKQPAGPAVTVAGRVIARRGMGKVAFIDIRDGSGKIQLLFRDVREALSEARIELLKELDIGDVIGVTGQLFRTKTGEPTVAASDFVILAKSLQPLPEKWHGLADVELRYRQRYLDLISNPEVMETFRVRSQTIAAVRQFLNGLGFVEVETPVLQPAAGGALARPFVTHHNALDQDFYLRIALELHLKRLIVGGFDKVYEIGRIFRNEGIDSQHSPEFTMLESYEAYADYRDVMKMVEEMVAEVARTVLGTTVIKYGDLSIDLKAPSPIRQQTPSATR
jgi:lysyl-tRNA synthetase class 2